MLSEKELEHFEFLAGSDHFDPFTRELMRKSIERIKQLEFAGDHLARQATFILPKNWVESKDVDVTNLGGAVESWKMKCRDI